MSFVIESMTEEEIIKLGLPYYKSFNRIAIDADRGVAIVGKPFDHSSWPDQGFIISINGHIANLWFYGTEEKDENNPNISYYKVHAPVPQTLPIDDNDVYANLISEALTCFYKDLLINPDGSYKSIRVTVYNRLKPPPPRPIDELIAGINDIVDIFSSLSLEKHANNMNGYLDFDNEKIFFANYLDKENGKGLTKRALEVMKIWRKNYKTK